MRVFQIVPCLVFWISIILADTENVTDSEACTYEGEVMGACVPLTACAPYVQLLKEGATTLQGAREVRKLQCGFDGASAKVCCPLTQMQIKGRVAKLPKETTEGPQPEEPDDFAMSFPQPPHCGLLENVTDYWRHNKWNSNCSIERFSNYLKKVIYRGMPVYYGMSRWMALLGYKDDGVLWQCGGTIITARHVLTAAHCIKPSLYIARVGEINYSTRNKHKSSPVDHLIKRKIAHEKYVKGHNDIGVLVLQEVIQFNNYVTPICLPVANVSYERIEVTESGYIEGWGVTENGTRATHLQYAYVDIKDNKECENLYKKRNLTLDESVVCAGGNMTDSCSGDSGGPLVWKYCIPEEVKDGADYHYQRGIISYGPNCQWQNFLGVYTNLEYFMPWLEEKVLGKKIP